MNSTHTDQIQERARVLLNESSPSREIVDELVSLIEEVATKDPTGGLRLGRAATEMAQKLGYRQGEALALGYTGYACYIMSRHEDALRYFAKAEAIGRENGDAVAWGRIYGGYGMVHRSLGNLEKALEYGFRGLQILREAKHRLFEAWQIQGIGGIYSDMGDLSRAREHHETSLELFRAIKSSDPEWKQSATVGEGRALSGLGTVLQGLGETKKAREYHEKSLAIFRETDNQMGLARALNDIGEILADEGQLDEALKLHEQALEIRQRISTRQAQSTSLLNIGRVYLLKNKPNKALEHLHQALFVAMETGARQRVYQANEALSDAYRAIGEFENALEHYRTFHQVKEEVLGDRATSQLKNLQVAFETEKSQREAEIQRLKNVDLREKNEQLEQLINELRAAQVQLIHSEKMASLGNLVAGVVHEINNPLGAMRAAIDTLGRAADRLTRAAEESGAQLPDGFADRISSAVTALKQNTKITNESTERISRLVSSLKSFAHLDEADYQEVDINRELKATLSVITPDRHKRIQFAFDYGELPRVSVHASELNQVFMNLFMNAIEAIDGEGEVKVVTEFKGDAIQVQISDTGRGIAQEQLKSLFDPNFSRKGSRVKSGMGLFTSYNIVRKHRGDISVNSRPGKGTTFTLSLPVGNTER